jgi:hypothetical protein
MGRRSTVSFENVAVSAVQDLVACKGSTGKTVKLNRVWVGATDTTLQTAQSLRLNIKFASATLTLGSGGSVPTPTMIDPGDTAAAYSCHVNDTVQATTSGAFTKLVPQGVHNYGGWDFSFRQGSEPTFGLNQGVIFELLSTVSGTCHLSGGAELEESGL